MACAQGTTTRQDLMADNEQPKDTAPEAPATDEVAAGGEEGAEAAAAAGGKRKLMLLGGAVFVVLAVAGAAAFFLLGGDSHDEDIKPIEPGNMVVIYDVPPITVNMLDTAGGADHFLKAKVALELGSEQDKMEVERLLPRLQDDWQNFLRQLRPDDVEGSGAMQRLKEAMMLRANQVLAPVAVHNVLFRELLVQ